MRTREANTTDAHQGRKEAIMAPIAHQLVSSGSIPAPTQGALPGHQATCSCGFVARTSLDLRFAVQDLSGHISYMESKTQKRGRR